MQKVLVLTQTTIAECRATYLANDAYDAYEIRIDLLAECDYQELASFVNIIAAPVILTLRTKSEGGAFEGDYKAKILHIAKLNPEYLDIEQQFGHDFIREVKTKFPSIKIIQSNHLADTPDFIDVSKCPEADLCKIVTNANSSLDALRVMHWQKANPGIILHAAGECGVVTRIFALILQQPLIFIGGSVEARVSEMLGVYKIDRILPDTKLLALLGNPIKHSLGRQYHNERLGHDAVYVNMPLNRSEVADFMHLLTGLPFVGFSITMPLKQAFKDYVRSTLPAINTLCYVEDAWVAHNTDGLGTIAAIGAFEGRVLLIGAGGSAAALAEVFDEHGICFTVLNRTLSKAQMLSANNAYDYDNFQSVQHETFSAVVNATPNNPENMAFISEMIRPFVSESTKYMGLDYSNPIEPNLKVQLIAPQILFFEQAALQLKLFQTTIAEAKCSLV